MSAPEPLSAEERAHIVGRARRGLLPSNPYEDFESYEATVQAVEAERDAWRALGREQMRECPIPDGDGCHFCGRIAALLGEDAS
jgi:hypothetical protein